MQIGVCEKDLRGTLRETLAWASQSGFSGVQVWRPRLESERITPRELHAMAEALGLCVSAVGGGPNLVIPAQAAGAIESFKGFLDLAMELGAGIVTAETKHRPPDLPEAEAWRSVTQTVGAICKEAEARGALLAIEPAGPCFIRDTEMFLELKRRVGSPALKVNYDPANIVWAGCDPAAGAVAVGPDIVHTHAKDVGRIVRDAQDTAKERFMDVPAGEGLVDYPAVLQALQDAGYRGFLTIEMHAGATDRRADILKAKGNLEAFCARLPPHPEREPQA